MQASIVLTVAQGKRLIARAVARLPEVQQALASGIVTIGRGTTNGYVAEELLGFKIPKGEYVAGRTLPPGVPGERLGRGAYPDIVLKQGKQLADAHLTEIIQEMSAGDVLIKGGNALNYAQQVVGILVGHPTSGTIGAIYGAAVSRKIHLIIPIGLEKLVYEDIATLSRLSRQTDIHSSVPVVSLFPITGTIITEIEAFQLLCGVSARLLAAGGVAGAEGAVWLLLQGDKDALDNALELYDSLQHEPNFGLAEPAE